MTNTELIQKIRAEVKRMANKYNYVEFFEADLLGFLSDLEKSEKPMNQEGFEKEIEKIWLEYEGYNEDYDKVAEMHWNEFEKVARHFYDLGCRRTAEKYDEIEYNRQRAEEETPNDLEEAAKKYATEWHKNPDGSAWKPYFEVSAIKAFIAGAKWQAEQDQETIELAEDHAFLAGSEWQKEQMMREAIEGEVCIPNVWVEQKEGKELVVRAEISKKLGFKFGDKVRIIIVKEDEK